MATDLHDTGFWMFLGVIMPHGHGEKFLLYGSILLGRSGSWLAVLHFVELLPQSLLHFQNFSHSLFEKSIEL